jgi:CheY-like chemotaxis protein
VTAAPVLIVEDDPSIRNLVSVALRVRGVLSHQAKDGDEALRLLAEARYAVLLLDIMMPGTSGYGVVEAIASGAVPRPTVVFITSAADVDRARLPQDIVHVLLRKPFEVVRISELVSNFLEALKSADIPIGRGGFELDAV